MRRLTAVVPAEEQRAVAELIRGLGDIQVTLAAAPDAVDLERVDVLWVHALRGLVPGLLPWLEAGGRLLATLDAAWLPAELGIEPIPPEDLTSHKSASGLPACLGLAAFGSHPLFEHLDQGTCTWAPTANEARRGVAYTGNRPKDGAVVAVASSGAELDPDRAVAWEYRVGQGGILCIGAFVHPGATDQRFAPQLRILLQNAIAGQAIPHEERPSPSRVWPPPGHSVQHNVTTALPPTPSVHGAWGASSSPLAIEAGVDTDAPWTLGGRRGFLVGREQHGLQEAWMHPFRVFRDAGLRVDGAAVTSTKIRLAPEQVERAATTSRGLVIERWSTALEVPALFWSINGPEAASLTATWTTDLRRMWPYPAGACGDLLLTRDPDGRRAMVQAVGDPFRVMFIVDHGALESRTLEGPAVGFTVRAAGHCRLVALAGADEADWVRTVQMLDRRGVPGMMSQRVQHARQLASYATGITTPEPRLDEAFEWAKVRMDECLAGTPGIGRSLVAGYGASGLGRDDGRPGAAWYFGGDACRTAMAQLAVGDRDGPRDVLKFLSLTQDVRGAVASECTTSGRAWYDGMDSTLHYLLLAARFAAWTGELDLLARHWVAIRRAYRFCCESITDNGTGEPGELSLGPCWIPALEELEALADALGYPEVAEEMRNRIPRARGASDCSPDGWAGLEDWVSGRFDAGLARWFERAAFVRSGANQAIAAAQAALPAIAGLWGVRPDAVNQAVAIQPWLPPGWEGMAIERLRVGRSVLDVRLRRRFGQVVARVERTHGPRIHVEFRLRGVAAPSSVLVDDVELGGARAGFEADGHHVLIWRD
ncbi:MAG TPA: hypothetical protein VFO06_11085 [Gemmatimonadales bacterium]|nr:hypothetical protein [Gemmatimonadales bacterium]